MRKALLFWGPLAVYALLVVYVSLTPKPPEGPDIPGIDKFYHFALYAVMGWLLARAVTSGSTAGKGARRVVVVAALAGFFFGVLMELGQEFVPERSPEALDAVANGVGALLGSIAYGRFALKKNG